MAETSRRVVLKLSGEALSDPGSGRLFSTTAMETIVSGIQSMMQNGCQVSIVIGGGNIVRGHELERHHIKRVIADQAGMLGTVINSLIFQEILEKSGMETRVMSAIDVKDFSEPYIRRKAISHLEKGRIVVFAAGTGNPFFTTDSAASLRAVEIGAKYLYKATKVDGVYNQDPHTCTHAVKYDILSYDDAIAKKLRILDTTAIVLCREHSVRIVVFNMRQPDAWSKAGAGEKVGTAIC